MGKSSNAVTQTEKMERDISFYFDIGRNCYLESGATVIKAPSHWVRSIIEMGNSESLELPTEPNSTTRDSIVPGRISDDDGLNNDEEKCSDGTLVPKSSTASRAPAFVPWGKYNLRSHIHCTWNSVDMESSVLFNIDENICHPMDDDSVENGSQEMLINTESPQVKTAEEWKSVLFDQYGVVDLSRMPPRVFLTLAQARASIREELRGILAKGNAGIPTGEIIWLSGERFTKLPKVMATMVTKLKAI